MNLTSLQKPNLISVDDVEGCFGVDACQSNKDAGHHAEDDAFDRQTAKGFLLIYAEKEAASYEETAGHNCLRHGLLENQNGEDHHKDDSR